MSEPHGAPPTQADEPDRPPDAPAPPTRADGSGPDGSAAGGSHAGGAPPTQADTGPSSGASTDADPGRCPGPEEEEEEEEPFIGHRLPPELAGYRIVRELPGGGQAAIYHCVPPDGGAVVVKIYHRVRPGIDDVWRLWQAASERHVVPLVGEPFVRGNRSYEVTPYLQLGSLDDRAGEPRRRLPEPELERILRQVADALHHIHTELPRMLIHRDIKPGNILVSADDPLQMRLTDFGIAVAQVNTFEARQTISRSAPYTAPEAFAQASTPYQDWWSLGMTLLELHQGRHPFVDPIDGRWQDDATIQRNVSTHPIPIDADVDERWRALFRGLLTRAPEQRWGHEAVRDWLDGHPHEVYEDDAEEPSEPGARGTPFPFPDGGIVYRPDELADAIADNWVQAAALVLDTQRRRELRMWAALRSPDLAAAIDAVHRMDTDNRAAVDRTVTELMVALDANAPPAFKGWDADEEGLTRLATQAAANEADRNIVDDLYNSGSLLSLAGLRGCDRLALLDVRWRRWCGLAERAVSEVLPAEAELTAAELLRSLLLAAAADPQRAASLELQARRLASRQNRRVRWFRRLADDAHGADAPAYHAVMVLASGILADPRYRVGPAAREGMRQLIDEDFPRRLRAAREQSRRSVRRLRRSGPMLAGALSYVGLVVVAAAGVASATSTVQGALTGTVLLAAGGSLYAGMSRPRHRLTDALLTAWAGACVGLLLAVVVGSTVGVLIGPAAGWPTFWSVWVAAIVTGAAWGAVQ